MNAILQRKTMHRTVICHCCHCRYDFAAARMPLRCPDCGKFAVRAATEAEQRDYFRLQEELAQERWEEYPLAN